MAKTFDKNSLQIIAAAAAPFPRAEPGNCEITSGSNINLSKPPSVVVVYQISVATLNIRKPSAHLGLRLLIAIIFRHEKAIGNQIAIEKTKTRAQLG